MSVPPSRILETIDRICLLGGAGGTGRARELATLYQAARSLVGEPLCAAAARRLEAVQGTMEEREQPCNLLHFDQEEPNGSRP